MLHEKFSIDFIVPASDGSTTIDFLHSNFSNSDSTLGKDSDSFFAGIINVNCLIIFIFGAVARYYKYFNYLKKDSI